MTEDVDTVGILCRRGRVNGYRRTLSSFSYVGSRPEICIEILRPSGAFVLSTIWRGHRVKMRCEGCSRREAISTFRQYLREWKPNS